jgi:hypothetical protein
MHRSSVKRRDLRGRNRKCPVTRRVYGRSAARTRILAAEEIRPGMVPARIRVLEEELSLSLCVLFPSLRAPVYDCL